jgi:hypothetical protein
LPTRVKITSNKHHREGSFPSEALVLQTKLTGSRSEPSFLSNQPLRFLKGGDFDKWHIDSFTLSPSEGLAVCFVNCPAFERTD